jgi:DNA invertase Pin-like site-specific DNA recombinase
MQGAQKSEFDLVLSESLDRMSRDQEDIAGLFKRLRFAGVKMFTLSEGEVSELHIGLKGTMGALYLRDLADKTRRGLRGRVEAGRSGGGNSYGYTVRVTVSETGELDRGARTINEPEARIIRGIFEDYAAGISPRAIAHALNRRGVAGPSGKGWGPSTINGNWRRGTGILNNELYIGRMVWNRLTYIKDPETGKRVSRRNDADHLIVKDVPDLRIVDQALWNDVKERQQGLRKERDSFWEKQRPRMLLSYLLKCGSCGGGFSKVSQDRYGCSTARNKNTCSNRLTVRQDDLEGLVIGALQSRLMAPDLLAEFCVEFTAHLNRLRGERNAAVVEAKRELSRFDRDRANLIQAIRDGIPASEVKDDLARIATRRAELEAIVSGTKDERVLLHPNMALHYRNQVAKLAAVLRSDENRAEAADLLRSLIDRIELTPNSDGKLDIDLFGDLAGILGLAANKNGPLDESDPSLKQVKLVAGIGFEPMAFRL